MCRFDNEVKERREEASGQGGPSLWAERRPLGIKVTESQTIPGHEAPPRKECKNVKRSPAPTSDTPPCYSPPFNRKDDEAKRPPWPVRSEETDRK